MITADAERLEEIYPPSLPVPKKNPHTFYIQADSTNIGIIVLYYSSKRPGVKLLPFGYTEVL